jgi:hypothetical protein
MRWREYNFTFGQKDPTPKVLLFFLLFIYMKLSYLNINWWFFFLEQYSWWFNPCT